MFGVEFLIPVFFSFFLSFGEGGGLGDGVVFFHGWHLGDFFSFFFFPIRS